MNAVQEVVALARARAPRDAVGTSSGHDALKIMTALALENRRLNELSKVDASAFVEKPLILSDEDKAALEQQRTELVLAGADSAGGTGVYGGVAPGTALVRALPLPAGHPTRLPTLIRDTSMPALSSAGAEGGYAINIARSILHSKTIKYGLKQEAKAHLSDTEDEDELELDDAKVHAFLKHDANGLSIVLSEVSTAINQMTLVYLTADQLLDLANSFLTMIKTYGSKGEALYSSDFRSMPATFQQTVGEFWFGSEKLQKLLADKEDTFYDSSSGEDIASTASNGPSTIDGSTKRQADGGEQSPPSKISRVSFSPEGGGASDDGASVNTESAVVDRFSAASRREAEDRRAAERMGEENPLPPIDEFEAFHDSVSGEESSDGEDELAFEGGYFAPW